MGLVRRNCLADIDPELQLALLNLAVAKLSISPFFYY